MAAIVEAAVELGSWAAGAVGAVANQVGVQVAADIVKSEENAIKDVSKKLEEYFEKKIKRGRKKIDAILTASLNKAKVRAKGAYSKLGRRIEQHESIIVTDEPTLGYSGSLFEMIDEDGDEGKDVDDFDDMDESLSLNTKMNMTRVKGSFVKMPKYGKRYKKRKNKRRKLVTKRGVKHLIANYVPNNRLTYTTYTQGFCYGGFGERGFRSIPYLYGGAWMENNTAVKGDLYDFSEWIASNVSSFAAPSPFTVKNYWVEMMFHNPMTETVIVTLWRVKQKREDYMIANAGNVVPIWRNDTNPIDIAAWPGTTMVNPPTNTLGPIRDWYDDTLNYTAGISGSNWAGAFADFPTKYKQWNDDWKIKGKTRFVLQPGQTKVVKVKFGTNSIDPKKQDNAAENYYQNADNLIFYQNLTQWLMVMTEGVPTHQNDGISDNATRYKINRCASAVEWTTIRRATLMYRPAQAAPFNPGNTRDVSTVTEARSIITQVDAEVKTV